MIRVLHVIGKMDRGGGAEALLMSYYRAIDREKIQFDFVIHTGGCTYGDEIAALGGKVYWAAENKISNLAGYKRWWRRFFEEHPEYTIVHGHILTSAAVFLTEAKRQGRYTIAHSHCTNFVGVKISVWLPRMAAKYPIRYIADSFLACSEQAGIDMFGRRAVRSDHFLVLMNAMDCGKFVFSEEKRKAIRDRYHIGDSFLVGHVGRFSAQKNHKRVLEIFACIHKKDSKARLLLLGQGELEQAMKQKCHDLNLDDAVIFAGVQANVEEYYSAMDVFVFPSLFEGLGNVVVEAQVSGLRCVVSDAVPLLADIGAGLFKVKSLEASDEEWAGELMSYCGAERAADTIDYARRAGYEILPAAKKLQQYYYDCQAKLEKGSQ